MLEDWKRRRAAKKVKPGDGRALQPFRWWGLFTGRKLFYLPASTSGSEGDHAVDVRYWGRQGGDDGTAHLYRDGRHVAYSTMPAQFTIDGGRIEVAKSGFGLKRMHLIRPDGSQSRLLADPRSPVGRRLRLEREHPTLSRMIGAVSIVLLVVGIGGNILQVLEPILQIPPVVERLGHYESPISLPLWLNISLAVGAALAGMERGLRLQHHWLLDAAGN